MKAMDSILGTRVFNRGDMANFSHWGTITKIYRNERFGDQVEITPDSGSDREPYKVPPGVISEIDKGNGLTRIVTLAAYQEYRQAQIEKLKGE